MTPIGRRVTAAGSILVAALALAVLTARPLPPHTPVLPSPDAFFGFPMGAEGNLARWSPMVDYFALIGEDSNRVLVEELGRTANDNPYLLVTISAPETIADLPRHRATQHRLVDPRCTGEAEAAIIAETGKAVLLVGANVHATEIATSQAMNTLVHFLATDTSVWTRHVLDNVIILVIPSENPDGQQMVVDWQYRNRGTCYAGSPLPELYHPYVGHDNNCDSYMLTQVETRTVADAMADRPASPASRLPASARPRLLHGELWRGLAEAFGEGGLPPASCRAPVALTPPSLRGRRRNRSNVVSSLLGAP